ncbi:MAG TPA: hypothetical protein VJ816_09220 [Gemmatimonadales bacterium]|nr:hypothetical protein [Gemmatimonadales bacterium]
MIVRAQRAQPIVVAVLALLTGCGGGGGGGSASSRELDRCALLTAAEIEGAIGPHGGGSSSLSNEWALQSCRWTATRAQSIEGYPDGWHDAIEVAAFDAAAVPLIRQQVRGDPLAGFVAGATYDHLYGELWFDCPQGRLCVVKAQTASGDRREQIVTQLARLVESRLR